MELHGVMGPSISTMRNHEMKFLVVVVGGPSYGSVLRGAFQKTKKVQLHSYYGL
jgi:hypothetical protein